MSTLVEKDDKVLSIIPKEWIIEELKDKFESFDDQNFQLIIQENEEVKQGTIHSISIDWFDTPEHFRTIVSEIQLATSLSE